MRLKLAGVAAVVTTILTMTASAHHSHSNYEIAEFQQLEGVVTQVHLLVPHSWLYLEVKDESGAAQQWALEATGPSGLARRGIKREDVKVGDRIKVRCHPLRDKSRGCLLGFLTPAHGDTARGDGVEKEWD
jgi:hypothetical protein